MTSRIIRLLRARLPDRHDRYHQMFQNIVDEVSIAAGGIEIERYIIPTGAMNAFALVDFKGRKVIGVTEGLLSRLTRAELTSVVAHEIAHIVSGDCLQTTIACALFAVYSQSIEQFQRLQEKQVLVPIPAFDFDQPEHKVSPASLIFPLIIVLFIIDILAQLLNVFISREREYRADAAAVRFTRDPLSFASALYKTGSHWRGAGFGGEYLAAIFIQSPKLNVLEEQENLWATLFSTHPPLVRRLRLLLDMAHANFEDLSQEITLRQSKLKVEKAKKGEVLMFTVERSGNWLGPYTIKQLMTLEWLMPSTALRFDNQDKIIKAEEVGELRVYFKAREDPLWRIRRICPVCSRWLIVENYEGLNIHYCPFCEGYLVEKDCLPRILVRKERGFDENVRHLSLLLIEESKKRHPGLRLLLDMAHTRRCAKCGHPMVHKLFSYAYHVEIDECQRCGLIWFDPGELEILQCIVENAETAK